MPHHHADPHADHADHHTHHHPAPAAGHTCSHGHDHGGHDHDHGASFASNPALRKVLWWALALNGGMFLLEVGLGVRSGSVALWADALDFAGDAASYAISLMVLGWAAVWRARAALLKAAAMASFGVLVLARVVWAVMNGAPPEPMTMGLTGALALAVNLGVALMLYAYRDGDANMRSVWLCSRNDAIGNVAVMLAAVGVFGTGTVWPDLAVAGLMAGLGLNAALRVLPHARAELQQAQK
ncbi:MAG: cation transporter [Burkholderiales bacterium PBB6]|nr:MAG: cation transporter [Burkholderiales bacterium PBB6]